MIVGIGIDLVEVQRIEDALGKHEGRMKSRLFSDAEQAYCDACHTPSLHYAARFAAKEAFSKAVGTGMTNGLKWKEIEILNQPSGEPILMPAGVATELMAARGATRVHVSLTHTRGMAGAVVVLER